MANKIRHLIVPGMAKSGTTFMWDQFVNRTDRVNFYPGKEIGYLAVGNDIDAYENFFSSKDNSKVYIDATPQYGDTYKEFAENAKACLKDRETQVIFCLRDPIARAFSHYRHDLSTHFWSSAMGDYSFFSEGALRRYVRPYNDIVKTLINTFGAENVHGYSFKQSKEKLPAKVLKFMGLPKSWKLDLNINPAPGGGLPRVVYDQHRSTMIEQDGAIYKLPAESLLICTNLFTHIIHKYPPDLARKFTSHSSNWTKELDRAKFGKTWTAIQKDYDAAMKALGMEQEDLARTGVIPYKSEMPIPADVLKTLEKVGTTQALSSKIYKESAESKPWISGNETLPDEDITLAGQVEKIQRVFKARGNLPERLSELRRTIEQFGPVRQYLTSYLTILINTGNAEEAIRILKAQRHAPRFIDKVQVGTVLKHKAQRLDDEDVETIRKLAGLD